MGLNLKDMIDTCNSIDIQTGVYPSRLIGIADLGLQKTQYKGVPKQQEQVALLFEIYMHGEDEEPIRLGRPYTKSIRETSNLSKVLNAVRNNVSFTQEEIEDYHLSQLLGSLCNVYIDTYEKDGQQKAIIKEVYAPSNNVKLPSSSAKYTYFEMDDDKTWQSFADMPPWIQTKINSCLMLVEKDTEFSPNGMRIQRNANSNNSNNSNNPKLPKYNLHKLIKRQ